MTKDTIKDIAIAMDDTDGQICYNVENIDVVLNELVNRLEDTNEDYFKLYEWKNLQAFANVVNDYFRNLRTLYDKQSELTQQLFTQIRESNPA